MPVEKLAGMCNSLGTAEEIRPVNRVKPTMEMRVHINPDTIFPARFRGACGDG